MLSQLHQSGPLGTPQGDSIREIYGTFDGVGQYNNNPTGAFYVSSRENGTRVGNSGAERDDRFGFMASRILPVDNEIRPINVSVNYYIRAIG